MILVESDSGVKGIIDGKCTFCLNDCPELFGRYFSHTFQREITYCRSCVAMTYSTDYTYYEHRHVKQAAEQLQPALTFQLSEQQQYASDEIIAAVNSHSHRLLYAVTGSGKTEMIVHAIAHVRSSGGNVAIVSPRVDVVKELAIRMNEYFNTQIDVLYKGEKRKYDSRFVICTVQQLFRYRQHFDFIVVDEVDAFPLPFEARLLEVIDQALSEKGSKILLTATPPRQLLQQFKKEEVIVLPARYHRRALPVPIYKFMRTKKVITGGLMTRLNQRQTGTYLLVFFSNIETMQQAAARYQHLNLVVVYAEDALRHEKVEAIRAGEYDIVFTTTILERGFTMAKLDVWVIDAGTFDSAALIQIAGRVDRKKEKYDGEVLFFHEGVTQHMLQAVQKIKKMNAEGRRRGWIEDDASSAAAGFRKQSH